VDEILGTHSWPLSRPPTAPAEERPSSRRSSFEPTKITVKGARFAHAFALTFAQVKTLSSRLRQAPPSRLSAVKVESTGRTERRGFVHDCAVDVKIVLCGLGRVRSRNAHVPRAHRHAVYIRRNAES
jgi:hypothetical protein